MKSAKKKVTALGIVFAALKSRGSLGATSDELEEMTGLPHQTVSARLNELQNDYLSAYITTQRRYTRSRRPANVYFAK
jgi:predicted transcriptional regulator